MRAFQSDPDSIYADFVSVYAELSPPFDAPPLVSLRQRTLLRFKVLLFLLYRVDPFLFGRVFGDKEVFTQSSAGIPAASVEKIPDVCRTIRAVQPTVPDHHILGLQEGDTTASQEELDDEREAMQCLLDLAELAAASRSMLDVGKGMVEEKFGSDEMEGKEFEMEVEKQEKISTVALKMAGEREAAYLHAITPSAPILFSNELRLLPSDVTLSQPSEVPASNTVAKMEATLAQVMAEAASLQSEMSQLTADMMGVSGTDCADDVKQGLTVEELQRLSADLQTIVGEFHSELQAFSEGFEQHLRQWCTGRNASERSELGEVGAELSAKAGALFKMAENLDKIKAIKDVLLKKQREGSSFNLVDVNEESVFRLREQCELLKTSLRH
uniref:Uncharacterized protein n=1 Tax=Palpitomonas bilix TaxID=652834 RepID=A0A7S3LX86_9EUKA|mmetsp:Transcript_8130/g.21518  ORF Transcript_8130/g.21518 Transcript_8130/m.21518 type:complete len:384 (+) Transcript_8130:154-1305(+)